MSFKVRHIFIFSCLFSITLPSNALIINTQISFFSIKPLTCVVNKIGDTCQLMATVQWRADNNTSVCLLQDEIKTFCWQNKIMGKQVIPIELKSTTNFTLVNNDNSVFASQKVNITSIQPTKKRRRLRSAWSIF